ncbi:hypothetical protein [Curtobacterium sp. VKM Ac-2922]|uniref:hypothetical protein n=1 Tax=Curtobacterium sp. VKM Ac-2922 TaxID=2929475 RepID=UPI001FB44B1F|nr:hypothetical protein [Curtobacterium sp. VKM Ac-2922]MCJ1714016.1 hypothetical protein [Curtobacterium sp. VKM Ac-2922]
MSTEPERRPVATRFRRRFVAVVLVLVVVAALAAVVGSQQGPRLRAVSYDATGIVSRPAQRVIITANQALQRVPARDVRVSPAAAHTVTSSGNTVAVEFAGPLDYDRDYTVTVSDARAPGQAATADLRATIRTGSTDVLALVPAADGGKDRIVRRSLDAAGATTVYQGDGITGYARLSRALVVLRDTAVGDSRIDIVPLRNGVEDPDAPVEHITLPSSRGSATALHAADDGASFGFRYADTSTGQSRDVGLYVVDMTGTHQPQAIAADGKPTTGAVPMTVAQWAYVPRTESALVRTGTDELFLVDMSGRVAAVRLGSATYLHGFVGTGTTAVVESGTGIQRLDLTNGKRAAITAPVGSTDAAYLGRIAQLTDDTYLRTVGSVRSDGTIASRIVRVDGTRASRLPVAIPDDATLTAVCPSPNGQFVAVETRSRGASLVSVVDASSGALEASLAGQAVDWCGALPSGDEVG